MKVAGTLKVPLDASVVTSALDYLRTELSKPPPEVEWWPVWAASQAYAVKVLAEFGRKPGVEIDPADRLRRAAADLRAVLSRRRARRHDDRGPRYQDVVRRLTNALRIDADRAHVEEIDDDALSWLWNTNVRATAVVLDGLRGARTTPRSWRRSCAGSLAARTNGRWDTTHENAMALEALVAYYRAFESGRAADDDDRHGRIGGHRHGVVRRPIDDSATAAGADAGPAEAGHHDGVAQAFDLRAPARAASTTRRACSPSRPRRRRPSIAASRSSAATSVTRKTARARRRRRSPPAISFASGSR